MADNVALPAATGSVATDEVQVGGTQGLAHVQFVKLVDGTLNGTESLPGTAANGLDVDVTRLPALVAGTANIGDVDVLTVPADPFGLNADSGSTTGSISAKLKFIAATGIPVTAVPADPFGANADAASATGSISAKLRFIAATGIPVTGTAAVDGSVNHDSPDADAPVKVGGKAIAGISTGTAVAAADRTDLYAGTDGVLIQRPYCGLEDIVTARIIDTAGAAVDILAAVTSTRLYLTTVALVNTSATNVYADILDGATIRLTLPLPAFGGAVCNFPVPIPGTAGAAWRLDVSAATTSVMATAVAFKSKV